MTEPDRLAAPAAAQCPPECSEHHRFEPPCLLAPDDPDAPRSVGVVEVTADECRRSISDALDTLRTCHPEQVETLTHALWLLHGVNL